MEMKNIVAYFGIEGLFARECGLHVQCAPYVFDDGTEMDQH